MRFSQREGRVLPLSARSRAPCVALSAPTGKGRTGPKPNAHAEVLGASAESVTAGPETLPSARAPWLSVGHAGELGQSGPGLLAAADAGRKSNPPRGKLVQAPGEDGRTAIGGILYTFLSAYRRLAPSELRRFILQSRPRPRPRGDPPCLSRSPLRPLRIIRQRRNRLGTVARGRRDIALARDYPAVENTSSARLV